ncbi:MAG: hypothetical protein AABO41_18780 [Acidobacteriota bacterium]
MITLIAAGATSDPKPAGPAPFPTLRAEHDIAPSGLRVIAMELEAAPAEIGGSYAEIISSAVVDSGEVAFSARLSGSFVSNAIFLDSNGVTSAILRANDDAPGGGKYTTFGDLDITTVHPGGGNMNLVMFRAEIDGGPAPEGIFLWSSEGVETVALAGQKSLRGNTYKSFSSLTIESVSPTENQYKRVFVATMEDGKKSVIFKASYDDVFEALTTGDVIGPEANEVVDDFTVSRLGYSAACVVSVHRKKKKKDRYNKVITLDAFLAVGDALKEGVRFPELGKVKHVFGPPAMNFQQGYASIEFKSGVSALATRDIDGASEIIAKSGDVVSDPSGEVIHSFGPPISNNLHLVSMDQFGEVTGPFGIVSPVRLSGGRAALWLGVFTSKVPSLEGAKRLLLIGGSAILDGQEVTLSAFSAVKLRNNGTLLVRGTIEDGNHERVALFVYEGLFGDQWR